MKEANGSAAPRKKVLIEASIIMMDSRDGTHRLVRELLRWLLPISREADNTWDIDLHLGMRRVVSLGEAADMIRALCDEQPVTPGQTGAAAGSHGLILRMQAKLFNTVLEVLPDTVVSVLQQANRSLQSLVWNRLQPIDFEQYDLVHLTLPQLYNTLSDCRTTMVVTAYDLSHLHYPQFHVKNNIVCAEKGMRFASARKSAYIAISEATRQDMLAHYPRVAANDVHTVYPGCDADNFQPVTDTATLRRVRQKYQLPTAPYFVSLSTLEPRKNLINSIQAFLRLLEEEPELDVMFVIAGKKGWKYKEVFDAAEHHLDRIRFTGFIDEEDLAAVYSGAMALSYVSYYEGFGLPPVEAMSCGVPVVYGNNSSMPEVIQKGGLPADPADVDDIKKQLRRIACDPELRNTLAAHALQQAQKFSWEGMARDTLVAYDKSL